MPPAWWPSAPRDAQIEELQALHERAGSRRRQTATRFFAINERFHMRLLEIAGNRWRDQMVADLRKVMKLNRHNSLLKSGRMEESLRSTARSWTRWLARDAGGRARAHAASTSATGWKRRPEDHVGATMHGCRVKMLWMPPSEKE